MTHTKDIGSSIRNKKPPTAIVGGLFLFRALSVSRYIDLAQFGHVANINAKIVIE